MDVRWAPPVIYEVPSAEHWLGRLLRVVPLRLVEMSRLQLAVRQLEAILEVAVCLNVTMLLVSELWWDDSYKRELLGRFARHYKLVARVTIDDPEPHRLENLVQIERELDIIAGVIRKKHRSLHRRVRAAQAASVGAAVIGLAVLTGAAVAPAFKIRISEVLGVQLVAVVPLAGWLWCAMSRGAIRKQVEMLYRVVDSALDSFEADYRPHRSGTSLGHWREREL